MPKQQVSRTSKDVDEEADASPLLKGMLIAFIPSVLVWAALIYAVVKLASAIWH